MAKKITKEMTQKEKKEKYLKELQEIFKGIDGNKKKVLFGHLDNLAYMKVKLELLQEMIDDGEDIHVNCHFCNKDYTFTVDELKEMKRKATR